METPMSNAFVKTFNKNDVIFSEGEIGNNFYVIRSGKVKIIKIGSENKLKTVEILEAGSIFGEMAILEKAPRSATIMVETDNTQLLELNKSNFKNMFFEHTETLIQLIRLFAKRIWHTQCRIEILETENKNLKLYKTLDFLTEDQVRRMSSLPTTKYSIYIPDALHIIKEWTNIPGEDIEKTFKDLSLLGIVTYEEDSKLYVNNVDEMRERYRRMSTMTAPIEKH
jgi:CRP/FNR family cyclic AMP-dependent transcriptional regulator